MIIPRVIFQLFAPDFLTCLISNLAYEVGLQIECQNKISNQSANQLNQYSPNNFPIFLN